MKRRTTTLFSAVLVLGIPATALGDNDHGRGPRLQADPFVFVGKAGDCGTGTPAGSNIVTAAWLGGAGLPDNGGQNPGPDKRDRQRGLLLSKNGPTSDCSAAGAEIKGVKGMVVGAGFTLGYDYRNGSHCGAGAPRFNVSYTLQGGGDAFSFVGGCSNDATPTAAPQDPGQWSRVRFQTSNPAESFPVIPVGSRIKSINLIFDEGTDTPTAERPSSGDAGNPAGIGLSVVDNILIGDTVIASGKGVEPKGGEQGRDDDD